MDKIELLRLVAGRETELRCINVADDECHVRQLPAPPPSDAYERWAARMYAEDQRKEAKDAHL
jgi:hypothetical protein